MRIRRTREAPARDPHIPTPEDLDGLHRAALHELVLSARLDDIPTDLLLAPLEDLALDRTMRARYRSFRP